jgi:A/G-specific adenine glycosylase
LFDLGASLCTPAAPGCALCPWIASCAARRLGIQASLPRKSPKKDRPVRYGVHFWLTDDRQTVLLRTRPYKGLLGGMTELPGTPWRDTPWTIDEALTVAPMQLAPIKPAWRAAGQVRHGFTHFELILEVLAAHVPAIEADGFAQALDALDDAALPSVMRKCVRMASA